MHGRHDGCEIIIEQHHFRCFPCRFGAGDAHGRAHIGLLERWCVVHPVAGHGDDGAARLKGANDAELMFGAGARENADSVHRLRQFGIVHPLDVGAGHRLGIVGKIELARYGAGRLDMVAGDHLDRDTCGTAFRDGPAGLVARRIDKSHETQHSGGLQVLEADTVRRAGQCQHGEAQQPLTLAGCLGAKLFPAGRIGLRLRQRQHRLRCALDEDHMLARRRAMQGRHIAIVGIERDFIQALPFAREVVGVEASLPAERDQRALHRIARHAPFAIFVVEPRVVAEHPATQDVRRIGNSGRIVALVGGQSAFGRIAGAADSQRVGGGEDMSHRHFVAGEGARLVGADDGGGTERLYGGQLPDDRLSRGHALHADRERDRNHGGQPFRDRARSNRHDGNKRVSPVEPAHQDRKSQEEEPCTKDCNGQLLREAVHLAQQWRDQRGNSVEHAADFADFSTAARGYNNADRLAFGHQRSRKCHRRSIAERRVCSDRVFPFLGRHGFAGQGSLFDRKATSAKQAQVGGHAIARLQRNDIAWNDVGDVDGNAHPVSHDHGVRREQCAHPAQRLLGAPLLHEADNGVHQDDKQDHDRVDRVIEQQRGQGRDEQEVNKWVVELYEETAQRVNRRFLRQTVRSSFGEAARGFIPAQPVGLGDKGGERFVRGRTMPGG